MSFLKIFLNKTKQLVSSIKVSVFNIKDTGSMNEDGLDRYFENNILWGVDNGTSLKHVYAPEKKKSEKEIIDFNTSAIDLDISEILSSRYKVIEDLISVNAPWDIEEEIKQVKKDENYRPAIDLSTYVDLKDSPFVNDDGVPEQHVELDQVGDITDAESIAYHHAQSQIEEEQLDGQHEEIKETIDYQTSPEQDLLNFKPHRLALAEPEMIAELQKKHIIFYNLLARIQETHAPNDFVSAYQIQDRVSYLLDNKTLMYKNLVKQLIVYIDQINKKLQAYYDDVHVQQQDLKIMNAQISRFKHYSQKSQESIEELAEQKQHLKEDITELETSAQQEL